jgi:hypothetical protein
MIYQIWGEIETEVYRCLANGLMYLEELCTLINLENKMAINYKGIRPPSLINWYLKILLFPLGDTERFLMF